MHHRPLTRSGLLTAIVAGLSAAVLSAGASAATTTTTTATGTTTTSTSATPTPHLGVSWTVLEHRCRTVKVKNRRERKCGLRPVKTTSHVHLAWKQHGRAYVHLTLAGQPIPNASVTVSDTPTRGTATTTTATTNAQGRFTLPLSGPNSIVTLSYTPTQGTVYATSALITQRAYLSLKVGHLAGGHRGHFYGIVFGGHIPENLYVQFFYLSASAGWQPFAGLATVNQHNGHWSTYIKIPADAAGYRYDVKAQVVPSRYWPYAITQSKVISRIVS